MHSGKMFEAGKKEAYEEVYRLVEMLAREKEGVVRHVDANGNMTEYIPLETLRVLGMTLMSKM